MGYVITAGMPESFYVIRAGQPFAAAPHPTSDRLILVRTSEFLYWEAAAEDYEQCTEQNDPRLDPWRTLTHHNDCAAYLDTDCTCGLDQARKDHGYDRTEHDRTIPTFRRPGSGQPHRGAGI